MKRKKIYIIIITIITALLLAIITVFLFTKDNKINKDVAIDIALNYANINKNDASNIKLERDDSIYEIEFNDKNYKYEMEIHSKTGNVIKFEKDIISKSPISNNNTAISEEEAKKIATDYLNINVEDVSFTKNKLDYDDGILIYELEFYYNDNEYEIDINAYTKEIINISIDSNDYDTNNSSNYIGLEKAKELVENHYKKDNIFFVKAEFDFDNKTPIYELEFYDNNKKYEYEVNAISGNIIKYEISNID